MSYTDARNALDWASYKVARAADRRASLTEQENARLERALARADAAEREERRDRARKDADRCWEHQEKYDRAFAAHGRRAPEPTADAHPPTYRRDLFKMAQSMLPAGNELVGLDPEEIDGTSIIPLERLLLEALASEAEEPTGDNVPGEGEPLREVTKTDSATGLRTTAFYGESFIKSLSRPARRAFFVTPTTVLGRAAISNGFRFT
jgi:hypothetical protein